ncbi:hypothetical protein PG994_012531 [Apiospora phragmitis]|uniref:Uncharacterized protein n=1 Tax=Apiospora phragmitis TaxID=2905665 RepID=A0ABR1TVV9_9PEZI
MITFRDANCQVQHEKGLRIPNLKQPSSGHDTEHRRRSLSDSAKTPIGYWNLSSGYCNASRILLMGVGMVWYGRRV